MITYIATNTSNGKFYIGSTVNFEERKKAHLNSNEDYPFQRALRKNPETFAWEFWEDASEKRELEQALLDMWFGKEQCYNLSRNAYCPTPPPFKSEEHRKNIGLAHKGKKVSQETREKISKSKKGKRLSEAHKAKLREIQKEVQNRPELKKSKAEKTRGQKRTEEQRERMRTAQKEAANRPEVKAKKSRALRGKSKSPESIAKGVKTRTGMKFTPRSEEQKQKIRERFKDPIIRARMSESAKANKYYDPDHPEIGTHNAGNLVIKQKSLGYPHGPENRVRVE
jgi:group I intron endonuclease